MQIWIEQNRYFAGRVQMDAVLYLMFFLDVTFVYEDAFNCFNEHTCDVMCSCFDTLQ